MGTSGMNYSVINKDGDSPFLLLCDHACRALPTQAGDLGLEPALLGSHIAWDIGALAVARLLAKALDAPLIYPHYSRLYIDCNRPLNSEELIPEQSCGVFIPGNQNITADQRMRRLEKCFLPYHDAIEELIDSRKNRFPNQSLVAVHSFTPMLKGRRRPWDIGVTYLHPNPLSLHLLKSLGSLEGLQVGDNKPYDVNHEADYSIPVHAAPRGLSHVLLEIRQDHVAEIAGQSFYANMLASELRRFQVGKTPTW